MRILVDILHPKQAHFFRPLISRWQRRGDSVQIVTRDKDITHDLLDSFGLSYVCLSKQRRSIGLVFELIQRWVKMIRWIRRFRPDVVLSVSGISTSLPARLLRVPNIAFTDTETARLSNKIAFRFADRVLSPEWFLDDFGRRHHRYRGFHEWSYLNPDEFEPDPQVVSAVGIDPTQPYAFVRMVRWDATHDLGEHGLAEGEAIHLVEQLAKRMRVVLSSEVQPPPALEQYVVEIAVDRVHHILALADLIVGESPSMATEAALLGVPSVLISSWAGRCGNMQVLQDKFGLMQVFELGSEAIRATLELVDDPKRPERTARRDELVRGLEPIPELVDRHISELVVSD